ncbi:MAG: (2Fe-2S)-binding protein [Pseudomonadales bacterium]
MKLNVNGKTVDVDVEGDTPLLWVLREHLGLTGTKYGCGIAQCGSCTVHIDGVAQRTCVYPVSAVTENQEITTIEGLGQEATHPVQEVWAELDVAQCGYCQTGMIMAVSSLLEQNPTPTDDEIRTQISNICRCGTYPRVLEGVKLAAERINENQA